MSVISKEKIHNIVESQYEYFKSGETLDISFRISQLKKLKNAVIKYEKEIEEALYKDLGRSKFEAYLCDIGPLIREINETIHGLKKWAKPETHFSGLMCFPSLITKVYKMPYGVCLIISPFNFPILLTFGVLLASIAGGNTSVLKTSSKSIECTKVMKKIVEETFSENYVALIDGGHDVADLCLEERFDKIFYTGSPKVAKHIMSEASKNITPVALELGGESGNWCIIRKDANIKDAARKIAFIKIANAGQICININQIALAIEVKDEFIKELKQAILSQLGENIVDNDEYSKLISLSSYEKCESICDKYKDKIVFGGKGNKESLRFSPTILCPIDIDDEIVNHELFSPILPIVTYKDEEIDKILSVIASREHPLAMYLFTKDLKWAKKIMQSQQYGGGCINEVCLHMMVKGVPFNGTGHSGIGAYHGEWGFKEFSHPQSVMFGKTHFNLSLREHPYKGRYAKIKMKILKKLEK